MAAHPATSVKVVSVEPAGDTKVRIMMEMIADVHRLAEVGSELLHSAVEHIKTEDAARKRKRPK